MRKFLVAALVLLSVLLYYSGLNRFVGYSLPMLKANYAKAIASPYADKAEVLYNGALDAYEQNDLEGCKRVLALAYEELVNDEDASIKARDKKRAADIKFMLGKVMQKLKKNDHAIEAYEQSLRLDPSNLASKYNLEMLKPSPPPPPMSGGGGGKDGEQPGDGEGDNPAEGGDGQDPHGKTKPKI
ncbi:MAG: tetratricopeptide repeat protein [Candidatus Obscuribacterales bacterium]|nr:tetratricopeptide repeat protein [Candidatus Obscuribacterales bacterium]